MLQSSPGKQTAHVVAAADDIPPICCWFLKSTFMSIDLRTSARLNIWLN